MKFSLLVLPVLLSTTAASAKTLHLTVEIPDQNRFTRCEVKSDAQGTRRSDWDRYYVVSVEGSDAAGSYTAWQKATSVKYLASKYESNQLETERHDLVVTANALLLKLQATGVCPR